MVPITFSILCGAACTFLFYVLLQFRRELLHMRKSSDGEPRLTAVNVRHIEATLKLAPRSCYANVGQRAKNKTSRRKEVLTGAA
jgi:hypothetical protein